MTWKQRALAQQDVRRVECGKPHILEMTGRSVHVPGRAYPSEARWAAIVPRLCTPLVEAYLQHPIDPHGRFAVNAIIPLGRAWLHGDRDLRCALGGRRAGPTRTDRLVGKVDPNDQSMLWVTGSCLSQGATDMVGDCAAPHFAEVTGVVDLTSRFDHPPTEQEVFDVAEQECRANAESYLGRSVDPGLSPSTMSLLPESWNAGSYKVNCIIGKFENGQWVDLSGALR